MKKQTMVTWMVFLAMAVLAGNAGAQPIWGSPWAQTPYSLGLTAEQASQIQTIMIQRQQDLAPLWSSLQAKNIELQSLSWAADPDRSAVEALAKEMGDIRAQIQGRWLETRNAIRGVLTEAQRTLFDQQNLGFGWGGGPAGLGMGPGWCGGFGRGGGFAGGRGRGWSMGAFPGGAFPGMYGGQFFGGGRGPCGMGLGATPMGPCMGQWRW